MNTIGTVTTLRNAALMVLALGIAAGAALPAHAAILEKSGDKEHHDCLSRQEVKWDFQDRGLRSVKVSRTSEDYVYRVSGYVSPKKLEEALVDSQGSDQQLLSKQSSDKIRYIVLFDACEHRIVEQIAPPQKATM